MEYEEGKVYLQNTRTGEIYLYERYMAHNKNYVAIVPNPIEVVVQEKVDSSLDNGSAQTPESA